MILDQIPEVKRLSADEKWRLIDELWEELVPKDTEARPEMVALLEARMAEYRENPALGSSWSEVKARLKAARGA